MRVAIVGCGRMGRERAKAARSLPARELLLLDEDRSRAEALAAECPGARAVGDPEALFREKLDALFVCTPPHCRGDMENRAIDAGIPFFVEKPIGVNAAQVRTVLDNLARRKVLNAVGYMNRYRHSVAHARSILKSRQIIGIAAHWVGKKYGVAWWLDRDRSGGPLNEQATHLMDLFRCFAGPVDALSAAAQSPEGVPTTVLALLRLQGGGLGSFFYSCEAKDKDILISIQTTDGVLELRGWDLDLALNTIDGSLAARESKPIFEKETHAFLQAVSTGDGSLILSDFPDAFETQLAMDRVTAMLISSTPR